MVEDENINLQEMVKNYVMPGEKICSVNVNISNPNTLLESLSKKLESDSINNEKKCLPYWNESCQEMSNLLWSNTKIGSFDLASICSNGSAPYTLAKSWFTAELNNLPFAQHSQGNQKWLRTSFPSSIVSQLDGMDYVCSAFQRKSIHLKSLRIRIYPEKSLHQIWKQWLAASRYCFNQAIAYQRKHGLISKYDLRKVVLKNESLPDWIKESPYHLKVNGIYDAHAAFKASRKSGTKQQLAGKFRSIRDRIQSIKFRVEDFKKGTWLPSVTFMIKVSSIRSNSNY
ncbi:MAG: transposase [Okeania sp. SIO3B3]|nr:transposase [Okeania sp. SIO3B3]